MPAARSRFYEAVDRKLGACELGPGIVARACAEVQRVFIVAPAVDFEQPNQPSRQPPRFAVATSRVTHFSIGGGIVGGASRGWVHSPSHPRQYPVIVQVR